MAAGQGCRWTDPPRGGGRKWSGYRHPRRWASPGARVGRAATALGHYFTELASAAGAEVTVVVASLERGQRLLELGASRAVVDIGDVPATMDVVLESVGGSSMTAVAARAAGFARVVRASRARPGDDRFLLVLRSTPVIDDSALRLHGQRRPRRRRSRHVGSAHTRGPSASGDRSREPVGRGVGADLRSPRPADSRQSSPATVTNLGRTR